MEVSGRLSLLLLLLMITLLIGVMATEKPSILRRLHSNMVDFWSNLSNTIDSHVHRKHQENAMQKERTFGHKRIQFMIMPMIYKMGIIMTMLVVITVISFKGLMIGVALFVLKLSTIFGKFFTGQSAGTWMLPQHLHQLPQPIHFHLHNSGPFETHTETGWETVGNGGFYENYYYKG
ncbi:PREDICTED: uncharacterized protein LOC105366656 isoform X1 [Ceratosolen solmsi marchali]|uniref:Uncharacterized protein LOC105366656 isoform X1 n=1 Tax=Ceratosolen solmsi marchali TaxID=326594 RepID=A0AAJ7E0S8_9HYME|nr:PREDICTED: uncharacterized protein LOC105366656 isoform X1 [Ceratosolen solmsi marchali]